MERSDPLHPDENPPEGSAALLDRIAERLEIRDPIPRNEILEALERGEIHEGDLYLIRDLLHFAHPRNRAHLLILLFKLLAAMRNGSLCFPLDMEFSGDLPDRLLREEASLVGTDPSRYVPLLFRLENGRTHLYFQKFFVRKQVLLERLSAIFRVERSRPTGSTRILEHILEENPVRLQTPDGIWRPMVLAPEQQRAVSLALAQNFLIVTGGPGTGKTSTVLNILRAAVRTGIDPDEIRLAAPTGRAARRMGESIRSGLNGLSATGRLEAEDESIKGIQAMTLHRLLEYRPGSDTFLFGPMNPLPSRLIVVDEISMVDLLLMSRLLEAVDPEQTTLVFLGDRDQLPSVEAGAVLADLVQLFSRLDDPGLQNRLVLLEKSHRSADPIMRAAHWIRESKKRADLPRESVRTTEAEKKGTSPGTAGTEEDEAIFPFQKLELATLMGPDPRWPGAGCFFLSPHPETNQKAPSRRKRMREAILSSWIHHVYSGEYLDLVRRAGREAMEQGSGEQLTLFRALFRHLNESRILTLLRRGAEGSEGINRIAEKTLRRMAKSTGEEAPLPGLPIMVTKNDAARELYNGDVGLLLTFPDGSSRALFEHGEGFRLFSPDALPAYEPAFAITVHKSQGSEYNRVLLVLPSDPEHPLLTGEILYTGLTRAKSGAILLGSESAIRSGRSRFIHRETGSMELFGSQGNGRAGTGEAAG